MRTLFVLVLVLVACALANYVAKAREGLFRPENSVDHTSTASPCCEVLWDGGFGDVSCCPE